MTFQYQLIFLGDVENKACCALGECFLKKFQELGFKDSMVKIIYPNEFSTKFSNKEPCFIYYLGSLQRKDDNTSAIQRLIKNGKSIFPLYFGPSFEDEVPKSLHLMNGQRYDASKIDSYVNCALESLQLLRRSRKLFISYRRTDSTLVANQLFDGLVKANYDVFLDTYSIQPAVAFQEELHHRLTDCDVLVQLYTNEFKSSKWCQEEILSANQKQIGIVELVWPDCQPDLHNLLCEVIRLSNEDFINNKYNEEKCCLTEACINRIIGKIESVRARNLAARQDSLVGEFIIEARKSNHVLVREYQYLLENLLDGVRLFIPAVGIPQSYDCFNSLRFKDLLQKKKIQIFLIYDDLRVKKKWIEHLDWLNLSLEVKTIKKKDFELWLRNN